MPKKYKVVFNRAKCIGDGTCAAISSKHWDMDNDGRASLRGCDTTSDDERKTKIFTEEELEQYMDAASSCPVGAIEIIDQEKNQRII